MWLFHPELTIAGLAWQARLAASMTQAWADILSPPEKGEVVPFRLRETTSHRYTKPAKVLKLADRR